MTTHYRKSHLPVKGVDDLPCEILPLEQKLGVDGWAELEQEVGHGLSSLSDHIRGEADRVLAVPVGEILLHHRALPVDDGEHQRRQAGAGGQGQQLTRLKVDQRIIPKS